MLFVKCGRLKGKGVHKRVFAAALPELIFRSLQQPAAEPLAPERFADEQEPDAKPVADRIAACKTYQGAAYTDASALQYLDRAQESRLVHPNTMKRLRFLLTMLAEQGEPATFRFMRQTVLKGKPFAE